VKEFDEFMEIPPCTKGWHSSSPDPAVWYIFFPEIFDSKINHLF
jgi:hypothetical protein